MGFVPNENDPFYEMHQPPPDETPAQRTARLQREQMAQHVSDEIDESLRHERAELKKEKNVVKVMLLGQAESGKSTTLKNFRMQYDRPAWEAERIRWRAVIQLNIVRSVLAILAVVDEELRGIDIDDSSETDFDDILNPPDGPQFNDEHKRLVIRLGTLRSVESTLMQRLRISPESRQALSQDGVPNRVLSESVRCWNDVLAPERPLEESAELDSSTATIASFKNDMQTLWADPCVQHALDRRHLRIADSAGFFLDQLDRCAQRDYVVLDDDILRARLRTIGIQEHRVRVRDNSWDAALRSGSIWEWRIFDVGGCRTDRPAWIPYFANLDAIIFLCPVSCVDERLEEDPNIYRLHDSIELWKTLCRSKQLRKTQMICFLNKCDLLKRKLQRGVQLRQHLVSYGDRPNDVHSAVKYLRQKFSDALKKHSPEPRSFFVFPTTATDMTSTAKTLESVRDGILNHNLERSQLI